MTDRREQLLDGATFWAFENGIGPLSLRPLAAALGTSDRMLLYYFGSKEQLIVEIAGRGADLLVETMPTIDPAHPPRSAKVWLEACWSLYSDPAVRPALSLLFELDALGTRGPGNLRDAARLVADRWLTSVDTALTALGVPARARHGLTPVVAGAMVGLTIDGLVGDEPPKPSAAINLLARIIDQERAGV